MDHLITLVFTRAESFGGFEDSIENLKILLIIKTTKEKIEKYETGKQNRNGTKSATGHNQNQQVYDQMSKKY